MGPPSTYVWGWEIVHDTADGGVRRRRRRPPTTSTCSRCTTPSRSARSSRSRRSAWPRSATGAELTESRPHDARRAAAGQPVGRPAVAGPPARRHRAGPGGRDRLAAARRGRRTARSRAPARRGRDDGRRHGRHRRQRVRRRRAGGSGDDRREAIDLDDDMLTAERVADPYPFFAELRASDPVHWSDRYRAWFILAVGRRVRGAARSPLLLRPRQAGLRHQAQRRAAARRASRRSTSSSTGWCSTTRRDHTRLRGWSTGRSRRRRSRRCGRGSRRWSPSSSTASAAAARADLIRDFAFPIPAVVIAEMLGVPAADRDLFKSWSDDIMTLVFGAADVPGRREQAQQSLLELADYLHELVAPLPPADPADNLHHRPDRRPGGRRPPRATRRSSRRARCCSSAGTRRPPT